MPAQKLTPEQSEDAKRLKALFDAWKAKEKELGRRGSQESALEAFAFGFGQSAFAQYINGRIPLNIEAASKFAKFLGCNVEDFSPHLASRIADIASRTQAAAEPLALKGDLFHQPSDEDIDVLNDFLHLIGEDREEVIQLIRKKAKMARAYGKSVDRIRTEAMAKAERAKAHAGKSSSSRAAVSIGARLRQRSLIGSADDGAEED